MSDALTIALGWLDLGASALLAGGLVFAVLVAEPGPRGRRLLAVAAPALAITLFAELAANAWRMHRISGIAGGALLRDVLEMHWTSLCIVRLGGLAVLWIAVARAGALRWPAAAFATGWLMLRSFQGHAGAHETAAGVTDWIHLAAASAWIGALAQLAAAEAASSEMLGRVRTLATGAVLTLVASGVYGALFHLHSVRALTSSEYGGVLVAKVAIAVPLFALGTANHFRLAPRAIAGDATAARQLGQSVRIELALGALVLGASALLGTLPMPHF